MIAWLLLALAAVATTPDAWDRPAGIARLIDRLDSNSVALQDGSGTVLLYDSQGKVSRRVRLGRGVRALYIDGDGEVVCAPSGPLRKLPSGSYTEHTFELRAQRNHVFGFTPGLTYFHPLASFAAPEMERGMAFGISPDGRSVALLSSQGGSLALRLYRFDKGVWRPSEPSTIAAAYAPADRLFDLRFVTAGLAFFISDSGPTAGPLVDLTRYPLFVRGGEPPRGWSLVAINVSTGQIAAVARLTSVGPSGFGGPMTGRMSVSKDGAWLFLLAATKVLRLPVKDLVSRFPKLCGLHVGPVTPRTLGLASCSSLMLSGQLEAQALNEQKRLGVSNGADVMGRFRRP